MTHQPFFIPAMLIGLFSAPLVFSLIPSNRFYGIRTTKTLSNEVLWYRANRIGGWLFLLSSLLYLLFAAFFPMTGDQDPRFSLWLAHLFFFGAPLVVSVACLWR